MTFKEVLAQVIDWLQQDKRLSYRALKRQFALMVDDHRAAGCFNRDRAEFAVAHFAIGQDEFLNVRQFLQRLILLALLAATALCALTAPTWMLTATRCGASWTHVGAANTSFVNS